jgi:hypothetical protein
MHGTSASQGVRGSDHSGPVPIAAEARGEENSVAAVNKWLAEQESDALLSRWHIQKDLEKKASRMRIKLTDAEKELTAARAKQASFSAVLGRERLRLGARISELEKELEQRNRQPPPELWAPIDVVKALQQQVL